MNINTCHIMCKINYDDATIHAHKYSILADMYHLVLRLLLMLLKQASGRLTNYDYVLKFNVSHVTLYGIYERIQTKTILFVSVTTLICIL